MYNIMFGKNQYSDILLALLKLTQGSCGRFRDVWIEDGKIVVYTRNGGGNRTCWECNDCPKAGTPEFADPEKHSGKHGEVSGRDGDCLVYVNHRLSKHPLYIKDYDNNFDPTYASFEFKVPDSDNTRAIILKIQQLQNPAYSKKPEERFNELMEEIKKMKPEQIRQEFPEITKVLDKIMDDAQK